MGNGSAEAELDTFEDGPYFDDGAEESFDDFNEDGSDDSTEGEESFDTEDEEYDSTKGSVQSDEGEKVDEDSQVNMLKDQEEKGSPKTEKTSDKSDEKSKEGDEEAKSEESSKDDDAKDDGEPTEEIRNLKAFRDGKAYEVPEDAAINVKINGKSEKVALKDLRDNYSGKVAYDEKFSKFDTEKKEWAEDKQAYDTEIGEIRNEMTGIAELVKSAQAGEGHPLAAFDKLLDLMGVNSVHYNKLMQSQMADELEIFNEMSDAERESYWLSKENKYLVNQQESARSKSSASEAQREQKAQISELREAHNVSEDDFYSTYEDMQNDGVENITPELIIQTAKMTPLLDAGEKIMEKYEEQLTTDKMDEMVREIAVLMYEDPTFTVEEIKSIVAKELEVETLISEVAPKGAPKVLKHESSKPVNQEHEYESFDDWD